MFSKNVLSIGIIMFIIGTFFGYGIIWLYPSNDISTDEKELRDVIKEFRTYMTCVPPSHGEFMINKDTYLHYNYDLEGNLTMIEIETSNNPDSPAWGYLPEGHPGMEFEHWALHIWLTDPEDVCLNFDSLIFELKKRGLEVNITEEIKQPFFSEQGKVLGVNGEVLQVYTYEDSHAATDEASDISSDGYTIGNTQVTWVNTPHFYQNGNLIVIYLGNSEELKRIFEEVIGFQFAGG